MNTSNIINLCGSLSLFFYLFGGMTADIGEGQPAYTIGFDHVVVLGVFFVVVWSLGYFTAKK